MSTITSDDALKGYFLLAGLGTRMRPLSHEMPKPVLPLFGRPLCGYVYDDLKSLGVHHFGLNFHYQASNLLHHLNEAGLAYDFFDDETDVILGSSGALARAKTWVNHRELLLTVNGDVITPLSKALMNRFMKGIQNKHQFKAILLLKEMGPWVGPQASYAQILVQPPSNQKHKDESVFTVSGLGSKSRTGFMYTGIALYRGGVLSKIPDPEGQSRDLVQDLFRPLIQQGSLGAIVTDDPVFDAGTPEDYFDTHFSSLPQIYDESIKQRMTQINTSCWVPKQWSKQFWIEVFQDKQNCVFYGQEDQWKPLAQIMSSETVGMAPPKEVEIQKLNETKGDASMKKILWRGGVLTFPKQSFVCLVLFFVLIASLSSSQHCWAWGVRAHELITQASLDGLSAQNRELWLSHCHITSKQLVEHSTDPDLKWRRDRRRHPDEQWAHFIHLDQMPSNWKTLSEPKDVTQGFLYYRIRLWLDKAQQDRKNQRWDDLAEHLFGLAHYVADVTMPLHTISKHEGKEWGLPGLHSQWEGAMVSKYEDEIKTGVASRLRGASHPVSWLKMSLDELLISVLELTHGRIPILIEKAKLSVVQPKRRRNSYAHDTRPQVRFSKPLLYKLTQDLMYQQMVLGAQAFQVVFKQVCGD